MKDRDRSRGRADKPMELPALSREQLATMLDVSHDVYFVLHGETNEILHVNATIERVLGYTAPQLVGSPFHKLLCDADTVRFEDLQFTDGVFGPVAFQRANGETCMGDVTVAVIPWEGEPALLYTLRDATERSALEEEKAALIHDLQQVLATVQQLSGLLPICANCKRIRDDDGYWETVEQYIGNFTGAHFSHGICPECREMLYPEVPRRHPVTESVAIQDTEASFERAVSTLDRYTGTVDRVTRLRLYALRQQATLGDCAVSNIDFTDGGSRARIDGWKALRGMPQTRARAQFVKLVSSLSSSSR